MEVGLHFIGYLLTFFFAFLYFPYLTFKAGAEYFVDLGRRRDSGEIEQFFAAVIPSSILNGLTLLWIWFGRALGVCPWRIYVDYKVVAAAISKHEDGITSFITDDGRRTLLLIYLGALMLMSILSGVCYGAAFRRITAKPSLRERIPARRRDLHGGWEVLYQLLRFFHLAWCVLVEIVCLFSYALWHPLFHEEVISLFPWAVQKPWLFVRMHNDRLYYGQFLRYDKAATGDIESITISEVRRYCYDEVDQCLASGRLPLSPFQGSLRINTSEITDIHNVPKDHFVHIQERYRKAMIKMLGRDLLTAFAGRKQVRVDQIYAEHAGGTELSPYRYRLALRKLEELRFVTITPTTEGLEGSEIPVDTALVDFPNRVTTAYDLFVRSVPNAITFDPSSRPSASAFSN